MADATVSDELELLGRFEDVAVELVAIAVGQRFAASGRPFLICLVADAKIPEFDDAIETPAKVLGDTFEVDPFDSDPPDAEDVTILS